MSNNPLPPPYGAPDNNTNGYMAPHMGSYNHAIPQHPYQQRDQAPFLYGQNQQNGQPAAPHASARSFHVNAHGVTSPGPGNAVNPATFSGGYGNCTNHTHHTAIPPPPYPPVPIPFGSSSYLPSHPTQSHAKSNTASQHNSIPSAPVNGQTPTKVQIIDPESSNHFTPATSELEDGEVNDGESDKLARSPEFSKKSSTFSRQPQIVRNEVENPTTGAARTSNTNGLNESGPGPFKEPRLVPNEQIPISSPQPQRPSNQNGVVDHLHSISSNPLEDDQHTDSPRDVVPRVPQNTNVLLSETLEEAKKALLELHSQGFDFTNIVNTIGVNTEVLRNIYAEVGIPVTSASPMQHQTTKLNVVAGDAPKSRLPVTVNVDQTPKPALQSKTKNGNFNSRPLTTTAKDEQSSVTSPAATKKTTKTSSTKFQGKASGIKVGESKVVNRKEYIARMLAAKASVSSKTSAAMEPEPPVQRTALQTPPIVLPVTNQPVVQPTRGEKVDTDMEAKRKAQTELARQKMEALKRTKSVQHESQTVKSSEPALQNHRNHQNRQPVVEHKQESFFGSASTVPQPPNPSHQGSYFSPASQKQPFSIPGLFMTPAPSEGTTPAQHFASQAFPPTQGRDDRTTSGSGYQYPFAQGADHPSKVTTTTQATSIPMASAGAGTSALPAVSTAPVSTHRKRQKASDFIDSPSTRVKRPLGQQEDTSVIIDISEDESNSLSDDDSFDMETDDRPHGTPKKSNTGDFGFGKQKSIKDLPPLTDLPPRKKPPVMTPPATQTPGQIKDAKGLKMEIELMNRKIAELEQRRHAKLNTSRTQTPRISGDAPVASPPRETSQGITDSSKASVIAVEPKSDASEFDSTRQSSSAAAETRESATTEKQLIAEQRFQEAEPAKAKAEQSLAADVALASEEDRRLQEETLQASTRGQASVQRDKQGQIQGEERTQLQDLDQQQLQGHEAQKNQVSEVEQQTDRLLHQEQEQKQSYEEEQRRLHEEQQKLIDRRSQIEAGLPVLDATVERTRQRLESLRWEIAELEKEIQDGVEGRRSLIEELISLSQATEVFQLSKDRSLPGTEIQQEGTSRGETQVPFQPEASVHMSYELPTSPRQEAAVTIQEPIAASQMIPQPSPPAQTVNEQLSDGELEEDVMDISRSDADEGEISDRSSGHITEDQVKPGLIDDEDSYEPPGDIVMSQNLEPDIDAVRPQQDDQTANANMPDVAQDTLVSDSNAEEKSEEQTSTEQTPCNANIQDTNMQDEDKAPHSSPSLADDSDPDDYEPPEPEPFEEEPELQSASANRSYASFSPLNIDPSDTGAPLQSDLAPGATKIGADPQEGRPQKSNHSVGRFTPYESPLKQFKSYRYHPAYLKEVSNGFRSLTYSHTIDPDIPICRYELSGICNDDSCQSQHLSGVGLNDDKILMSLGARPESLSEQDYEAFTDGLKQIIHDIRSRKVTDFNIVAAEITAYRAKFLGDSSKILPL